jgi:glycosyltransferase involved in cell wall biosynthesis
VVLRQVPDAVFTVVGRGDPEPYRRQARELGVETSIRFAGPSSDLDPFLAAADLFVLPSRWEGCPNAVLEAMAAGVPVVATGVGGTPELVVDGVTGLLCPPDSPQELAVRTVDLLRDPARARAMGDAGRSRAATEFPVRRMVARFESLYESLRGRAAPPVC